jgi:hypothetical protein
MTHVSASKMIFEPMVHSMQTVHLSCIKINTISNWTELPLEPHHLGVPYGASKMISELMVHLGKLCTDYASRLALSPNGPSFHLSLVTSEYHRVRPNRFLSQWYVWCKVCTYLAPTLTSSKWKKSEIPHDPRHQGVPSGASKMVLWAYGMFDADHAPILRQD